MQQITHYKNKFNSPIQAMAWVDELMGHHEYGELDKLYIKRPLPHSVEVYVTFKKKNKKGRTTRNGKNS